MSNTQPIFPVVLCGGSGTRLWPLSRRSFPKQFVDLLDGSSLLSCTLRRLQGVPNVSTLGCVAAEDHRFLVAEELRQIRLSSGADQGNDSFLFGEVILEPVAKNTAAAMALAALSKQPDDTLLFCPADHYIPDVEAFAEMVGSATKLSDQGSIVLFGIQPSYAATGYGYIEAHESDVLSFIEKPCLADAESMLSSGRYFWNAGIFLCRASALIGSLERHAPNILAACRSAMEKNKVNVETFSGIRFIRPHAESFAQAQAQSIDYAVMEKQANLKFMPFRGQWSDVGSWSVLADLLPSDANGNRKVGHALCIDSENTMLYGQDRVMVSIGVKNLVIVDTPDALLVATKDRAEEVKQAVELLDASNWSVASTHRKIHRPWGWYDSVDRGERFLVKRIMVKPGASLSLQMHNHRAEHWVVVKGTAKVTRGDSVSLLSENESIYIPIGTVHRLENPGRIDLEIIEIQSGSYLAEDDIVRLEDHYGRC